MNPAASPSVDASIGAGRGTAVARHLSDFAELTRRVTEAGLMKRRYGFYWGSFAALIAALGGVAVGMALLDESWLQLLMAGALGLITAQLGFLGHEACHRQVFRSARWNEWAGRVLSGLFCGISYGWWMTKHSRHHAAPNQLGKDPDIDVGTVVFSAESAAAASRTRSVVDEPAGLLLHPAAAARGPQPARLGRPRSVPSGPGETPCDRDHLPGRTDPRLPGPGLPGAAPGNGGGVRRRATGHVRTAARRRVRPQSHRDADRPARDVDRLPASAGADVAQHQSAGR